MEDRIWEFVAEAPGYGIAIILVWFFLKALGKRDETIKDIAETFAASSEVSSAGIVEESKAMRETLGVNSEVLKQCTSELRRHEAHH